MEKNNINPNFNEATEKQLDYIEQISSTVLTREERIQLGKLMNSCAEMFKFIVSRVPPLSVFQAIDLYFTRFHKNSSIKHRKLYFKDYDNQLFFVAMYMFKGTTFRKAVEEIELLKMSYTDGKVESYTAFEHHYQTCEKFRNLVNREKNTKQKY